MLAGRDINAHGILVVDLYAIRSGVDPITVGIAQDDEVVRSDIPAAVFFMHLRNRKLVEIDGIIAVDVLQNRPALDHAMRDRRMRFHPIPIGTQEFDRGFGFGQIHRQGDAFRGVRSTGEHAEARRVTGDVIKQDGRRFRTRVVDDLGDTAHLEVPIDPINSQKLTGAVDLNQRISQVGPRGRHRR